MSKEMQLLMKIHHAVRTLVVPFSQPQGDGVSSALHLLSLYTTPVPQSAVVNDEMDEQQALLYNLADAGYVRFVLGTPEREAQVGLASTALFFDLLQREHSFTLSDYFSLLRPVPPCDERAEHVVMQCLTIGAAGLLKWPSQPPALLGVRALVLGSAGRCTSDSASASSASAAKASSPTASPTPSREQCKSPFAAEVLHSLAYADASLTDLCTHVFKECLGARQRDALGADVVVFQLQPRVQGEKQTLVVHRMQVKLGPGSAKDTSWIGEAAGKFASMLKDANKAYHRDDVNVQLRHYLLTTRQHTPAALQPFCIPAAGSSGSAASSVPSDKRAIFDDVFNAAHLKEQLWTNDIKSLGKPFG